VHNSSTVVLSGKEYVADRAKLKRWLQLEGIREQIARAADREDRQGFVAHIYSYLSVALSVEEDFSQLPWFEVVQAYQQLLSLNSPKLDLPLLHATDTGEKIPWDYEGRSWYSWANMFSSAFGWSLEYVAELDVDDAIALLQEIKADNQMKREWEWMLTEVSYDRKGKHKELPRPHWMRGIIVPDNSKTKIKKSMLPVGNVVRWNETPDA
jgi:hypothetical protein